MPFSLLLGRLLCDQWNRAICFLLEYVLYTFLLLLWLLQLKVIRIQSFSYFLSNGIKLIALFISLIMIFMDGHAHSLLGRIIPLLLLFLKWISLYHVYISRMYSTCDGDLSSLLWIMSCAIVLGIETRSFRELLDL